LEERIASLTKGKKQAQPVDRFSLTFVGQMTSGQDVLSVRSPLARSQKGKRIQQLQYTHSDLQ
jgi:hypothetical protein